MVEAASEESDKMMAPPHCGGGGCRNSDVVRSPYVMAVSQAPVICFLRAYALLLKKLSSIPATLGCSYTAYTIMSDCLLG